MIAFDTETRSFRWWENPAFLGSWSTGGEGRVAVLPAGMPLPGGYNSAGERSPWQQRDELAFRRAVEGDSHKVGANIKFDAHMTREVFGKEVTFVPGAKVDDVLLMSSLLFGARRSEHGLKELAVDFVDPEADAHERHMQELYHSLTGKSDMKHDDSFYVTWMNHPEVVEQYAAYDAEITYKLYDILRPQLRADAKLDSLYREVERPVSKVLYDAERYGVEVDPDAVERLSRHYHERASAVRARLEDTLGFVPEGDGSQDRLRSALLGAGVPLTERTKETGELAVNKHALEKFSDHPAVAALFEFRRVNKFLSTYIEPLRDKTHIHPTFNQAQAWTGRMSGSNPNMQNIPKRTDVNVEADLRVRSVFVPSPGYEFIISDFDSIEMRVLAYYLGDVGYRRLIDEGDPHAFTAAAAAEVIGLQGTWKDFTKGTPNRWFRDIAKQGTYAIVYGAGGPTLMNTFNKYTVDAGHPEYIVDLDQAKAIRKKITNTIPGFKALTDSPFRGKQWPKGRLYSQLERSLVDVPYADGHTEQFGYVRTLMGRKQWIKLEKSYVALSGLIQGSAADIMKAAAINASEALAPYGGRLVLFVHDEVVAEVPQGWGERLKPILEDAMTSAATIDPPLRVETHVTARSYAHAD